jgi:serine/threonine-protein kinase
VTRLDPAQTERTHRWPDVLPGGEVALITARAGHHASFDQTSIVSVALDGSNRGAVLAQGTQPSYARTGHLIFARAGALYAVPFDPANLTVSGSPVAVLAEVMADPSTGGVHYSFSDNGALAYVRGQPWIAARELVRLDRQGRAQPVFERPLTYSSPRLSPDGRRLAVAIEGATDDLWVADIGSQNLVRLTYETGSHIAPVWTPDSQRIAFASNRFGAYNLFWKRADGSDTAERLTDSTHLQFPGSWSQDGALLTFTESDPTTGSDIWVLSLKDRRTTPLVQTRFNEHGPAISPDSRWVAYSSDESGQEEIYVQRFPEPGEKRQVSAGGGREPVWSRRGDALFYRAANRFMVVPVSRTETFLAGSAKLVTEGDYARSEMGGAPSFEVSPDGQSLLLVRERRQSAPTAIHVILDWFEELKVKVPVTK